MRFRVLGSIEAEAASGMVPLTRRRERCLLGVLLLHLHQVVTVDRLAELLWDASPPERARHIIHSYVSRLRHTLASVDGLDSDGHGWVVATIDSGYRLDTDPTAVDAYEFRRLVEQATQTTDPAGRVHQLRAALDLWRGPVFGDAATPTLRGQLGSDLEERRLYALEELMDASLMLRRERDILPELAQASAASPAREGLAALHMRALYQAGRKADALDQYARTRAYLADTLGIDPGPVLHEVYRAILRDQLTIPVPPVRTSAPDDRTPSDRTPSDRTPNGQAAVGPGPGDAFSAAVRYHRHRLGLTQEHLAAATGVSVRSIGKLEAGHTTSPRPTTVTLLADAFQLTGTDRDQFRQAAAGLIATGPGTTGTTPSPQPVPAQLPANVTHFTGRTDHLAHLDQLLPDTGAVVIAAVSGAAGVGKTALAVHAGHRLMEHYPDGQIFIDLHGFASSVAPVPPVDALDRLLRTLGTPGERIPANLDDRAALWRTVLAGRRMLIILDNAAAEDQVTPLLPGAAGCLVLITSRSRLSGLEPTHMLTLDVLPQPDAISLLTRVTGERLATEPAGLIAETVQLCGRLPLAIRIAAARLRSHPSWRLSHLLQQLRDHRHRLAELADRQHSVTATLDLSYWQLTAEQQRLYRLLGLHPGPDIEPYAAAALAGTTHADARWLLDQLLGTHLLQEPTPGRYTFHDLVRAHAAQTAISTDTELDRRAALTRLFNHYRHTAAVAMDIAHPHGRERRPSFSPAGTETPGLVGPAQALVWLDTELPNLLAAARYTTGHGWPEHTEHLSATLHRHLRTRGYYRDAEALHHQALTAARTTGNRASERDALTGLGWVNWRLGRYEQATSHYRQALEIARSTGDRDGELVALRGLGWIYLMPGHHKEAIDHFGRALEIARSTGDRDGELEALRGLGWAHRRLGRYEQATSHFERALAIARGTGHLVGELNALTGLGHIDLQQGRHEQAADHLERALEIAEVTGYRDGRLSALTGLGHVHLQQGCHDRAADRFQEAFELSHRLSDSNWQLEALHGLGRLRHTTGHPAEALTHHQRALQLAAALALPAEQARTHDDLAHAYHALGQPDQARQHWQHAMAILTSRGAGHIEAAEGKVLAIRAHLAAMTHPSVS